MAIVIYFYRFHGKKDLVHVAAELTSISDRDDSYNNYISQQSLPVTFDYLAPESTPDEACE